LARLDMPLKKRLVEAVSRWIVREPWVLLNRLVITGLSLMTLEELRHALEHALLHEGEMHREPAVPGLFFSIT